MDIASLIENNSTVSRDSATENADTERVNGLERELPHGDGNGHLGDSGHCALQVIQSLGVVGRIGNESQTHSA